MRYTGLVLILGLGFFLGHQFQHHPLDISPPEIDYQKLGSIGSPNCAGGGTVTLKDDGILRNTVITGNVRIVADGHNTAITGNRFIIKV